MMLLDQLVLSNYAAKDKALSALPTLPNTIMPVAMLEETWE